MSNKGVFRTAPASPGLLTTPLHLYWAKTENPLLPGVTKLISMLFFGDINWAKLLVLLK